MPRGATFLQLKDYTGDQLGELSLGDLFIGGDGNDYPFLSAAQPSQTTLLTTSQAILGSISNMANYLINGYWQASGSFAHHWASNTITYAVGNLNASEKALALSALNAWHEEANVTFVLTAGVANISFTHTGTLTAATSANWTSTGAMTSATVDISSDWITTDGGASDGRTGIYSYGYQTYLHEIGHALGLGHQGPYNGSATYGVDNLYTDDTWQYSVMSYFTQSNFNGGSRDYVITPEMADITAVQSIYGAASTRAGDTTYGFHSNAGSIYDLTQYSGIGTPAFTIYDSGGNDTLDVSGYSQNQTIDLTPGGFSSIGGFVHNIGIFTTTIIENAIGGSGNDTLTGNVGNNTLDGGLGHDVAVFNSTKSQTVLTNHHDGTWTAVGPNGTDLLQNIEVARFSDGDVLLSPLRGDLNSDGFSDLIFQFSDGTVAAWEQNAGGNLAASAIGTPGSVWSVKGVVDFNGDSKADLLFQSSSNGEVAIWDQNGFAVTSAQSIGVPGTVWQVKGAGDINGDGRADIIFQNSVTGDVAAWEQNGFTTIASGIVGQAGVASQVKGVADFNGDGKADLLFQNSGTGQVVIWTLDGLVVTGATSVGVPGTVWQIKGTGDFNGDGKADIVFQNSTTGVVAIWEMNSSNVIGAAALGAPGTVWQVVDTGDFNGDGKADLLFQNTSTGEVADWLLNGTQVLGAQSLGLAVGWHVV